MALESVFVEKFDAALTAAYGTGLQGAVVQGLGSGLMNGMVYFVECALSVSLPLARHAFAE
jgi:hypothetical protein